MTTIKETIYRAAKDAMKAARKRFGNDAKKGLDYDVVPVEGGHVFRARALGKSAEPLNEPAIGKSDVPVRNEEQINEQARKSTPADPALVDALTKRLPPSAEPEKQQRVAEGHDGHVLNNQGKRVAVHVPVALTDEQLVQQGKLIAEHKQRQERNERDVQKRVGSAKAGEVMRLVPKSRKLHASAAADASVIASAKLFTTFEPWGQRKRTEYPSLAAASAAAHLLRTGNPGRDVLVYAISAEGRDVPVSRDEQRKACADHLNALAKKDRDSGKTSKPAAAKPKAAKSERKSGQLSARAQAEADARAGKMPAKPDFSKEHHKRWRPLLDEIVAAVKTGDSRKIKAVKCEPKSSSRVVICRYRDLALLAIAARKAKAA